MSSTPKDQRDPDAGPGGASDLSVDKGEVERFAALAAEWWDPDGRFRPLHRFNPERIRYVRDRAAAHFGRDGAAEAPLAGLDLLDIGTGGGLMAEPMARLGARVTAIDPSAQNIGVARVHAEAMALSIDYRATTAEALARQGRDFDIVLMLEVVEHVADLDSFFDAAAGLVRPGGLLVAATLNRTVKSFALAIVGAEYVLGWLPRGTHDWNRFLTPAELAALIEARGLEVRDTTGLAYSPLTGRWRLARDTGVNYMIAAVKEAAPRGN